MMEAQQKVAAAANIHGKAWGRPVGTAEDAGIIIGMGAQFVVLGSEFVAMIQQMTACSGNFDDLLNEIGGTSASVHKASGKAY
jgi:2-keto-3-deoxy-L-rhamnonate aldolase RhmA